MEIENTLSSFKTYLEKCHNDKSEQSTHLSGAGDTYLFEKKLSEFYGKKFALTFSNATTAIFSLCIARGLKSSEIITSPVNWGGSLGPLLTLDNQLVFSAIKSYSLNMDVEGLEDSLTSNTKAVLSVDYNGIPADSKRIGEFCTDHNLLYISDSAQSFGAFRDNVPAGYYADVLILSFSPGKSLFGGEGGAILTDNKRLYESLISRSQHPDRQKGILGLRKYNEYTSINGRLNPLSAILLNETFESSLEELERYQKLCFAIIQELVFRDLIENNPVIITPNSSTYFNNVLLPSKKKNMKHISDYLAQCFPDFACKPYSVSLIPYDCKFQEEYKIEKITSQRLREQSESIMQSQYVKLTYSS